MNGILSSSRAQDATIKSLIRARLYLLALTAAVAICMTVGCAHSNVQKESARFSSLEDVDRFVQTYYQRPRPAQVPAMVDYFNLHRKEFARFEADSAGVRQSVFLVSFLSGAMEKDPESAKRWTAQLAQWDLNDWTRQQVWLSLRKVNQPWALALLRGWGQRLPASEQKDFAPVPSLTMPAFLGGRVARAEDIDANWFRFGATGDNKCIFENLAALSWLNNAPSGYEELMAHAAFISLQAHSPQHPLVRDIIVSQSKSNPSARMRCYLQAIQAKKTSLNAQSECSSI